MRQYGEGDDENNVEMILVTQIRFLRSIMMALGLTAILTIMSTMMKLMMMIVAMIKMIMKMLPLFLMMVTTMLTLSDNSSRADNNKQWWQFLC